MLSKDDLLREAIRSSGYYQNDDIITLRDFGTLNYTEQIALLLAREVARCRPDLLEKKEIDLVYIVRTGDSNFGLPSTDLTTLLENEEPFDDRSIGVYSLSKRKLVNTLYYGDGLSWVSVKGKK